MTERERVRYTKAMNYQFWIVAGVIFVALLVLIWVNGSVRGAVKSMWGTLETESAKKFFFFSLATLILILFAGSVAKRGLTIKDALFIEENNQTTNQ